MKLNIYLKSLLSFFIPFFSLIFIISIFYYFDIINNQSIKYYKIFIIIISSLIGGISIGKMSLKKGYLNGLILSLIIIILFFLTNLILKNIKLSQLIFYLIITICTVIGSMIGINFKKN